MLAPLQTGAARFSSYLLSRARKVLGSHLFSPCGVPEFCSISTRKLAAHGFGASMAAMVSFPPQRYHYFLVLDFEATCDKPQIHPQEIIEFPILKLNGRTMEIESTFHMYVQPVVHPQLTPFCTELTGIIQAMVDGQPSLQQVLERVDEWMAKEGLLDPNVKSIFVTCGDWDLKVMLPGQCQYLGLPVADYFKQWINLKKAYSFAMGCWPKNGLLDMNKGLSLQHIGRPHSGIGQRLQEHCQHHEDTRLSRLHLQADIEAVLIGRGQDGAGQGSCLAQPRILLSLTRGEEGEWHSSASRVSPSCPVGLCPWRGLVPLQGLGHLALLEQTLCAPHPHPSISAQY
ncbi:PREDICTED: ERI1 exoribonuclease 3 isoform X1 [Colobus angolensis palliatus]|uniref:ERI1 exoribonuclease 3 isoform X1 n=1 Tax=Colobus angolensis palliatus TaxID=336983 RepID=UPI0005F4C439|nr:PREDICTED: ERI1 exoribonuclease 3 isoform X1 [Colobus angolensis palliatus]